MGFRIESNIFDQPSGVVRGVITAFVEVVNPSHKGGAPKMQEIRVAHGMLLTEGRVEAHLGANMLVKQISDLTLVQEALEAFRKELAKHADQPKPCAKCKDSGQMDSGGVHQWGEHITISCDCRSEQP